MSTSSQIKIETNDSPAAGEDTHPTNGPTNDRGGITWLNEDHMDEVRLRSPGPPESEYAHFRKLYLSPLYFDEVVQRSGADELGRAE